LCGDAALYEPPPPRIPRRMGRPRSQGRQLVSPPAVVAHTPQRPGLTGAWSGGSPRDVATVTGTGSWDRSGEALVEGRWLDVHDGTGTHRDESFFTTDMTMKPQQLVACDTQRWSIDTTFQKGRAYVTLASTKSDGQQTVRRFTPCVFGRYTVVVLRSLHLPCASSTRRAGLGSGQATATCSDMRTCVRRALWAPWCLHTQTAPQEFSKRSQP
jgi:hypothetical protein